MAFQVALINAYNSDEFTNRDRPKTVDNPILLQRKYA